MQLKTLEGSRRMVWGAALAFLAAMQDLLALGPRDCLLAVTTDQVSNVVTMPGLLCAEMHAAELVDDERSPAQAQPIA